MAELIVVGKHLALLLFISLPVLIYGQSLKIDSLKAALQKTTTQRNAADVLHQLATETWNYDFEQAVRFAQNSHEISLEQHYKKGVSVSLSDIGLYYYFKGNPDKARTYFTQALKIIGKDSCGDCQVQTFIRLGNLYRSQARFDSAQWYYKKSFSLSGGKQNYKALSFYYFNYGVLQNMLSRYDSALFYLRKSVALQKHFKDSLVLAQTLKDIGLVHKSLGNYDSAKYYYDRTGEIADHFNNPELKMLHLIYSGELYFFRGNYTTALNLYNQAFTLFKLHGFKIYSSMLFNRIGQVYDAQGDYYRALEHFFMGLEIDTELKNQQGIAHAKAVIGQTYLNQGNDSTAMVYVSSSLVIMDKINDPDGVAVANNLIGCIYMKRGKYDKADEYFQRSLFLLEKIKALKSYAYGILNLAQLYDAQHSYTKALGYSDQSLHTFEQIDNIPGLLLIYNLNGSIYIKTKNYDKAKEYLEKARKLALTLPSWPRLHDCYKHFAAYYQARGDYPGVITFYEKLIALNDSMIYTNHSYAGRENLTSLYHVVKKEDEIKSLQQENQIKQAEITLQQSRIKGQEVLLIYTVIGIILLAILAYTLFKYYRAKSVANDLLHKLNDEVNEQKEEIQAQTEELVGANHTLLKLNSDLIEKQEEIQAQSEELRNANETIGEINRQLENTISMRTNQLKEAYKELDTFFYRSSHDFRRPLTTFMGLAEVAKITVKDTNALELFEKVSETAHNLDKMIIKLQSVSDVGAQQLVYKEVIIKDIFENICHTFAEQIRLKNIRTVVDIHQDELFYSYPAMVKIIIENLVENSIQFADVVDPYIRLITFQTHNHIIISIEDNGQGVPEKYQDRIFDMYFRCNERSKGNGLGLYIVKKAIEKLDGSITVESKLKVGSVFSVELPINTAHG